MLDHLAIIDGRVVLPLAGTYAVWIVAKIIGSPR